MRILVLTNLYPPFVVGGYERLCFEVSSALVEKGHDLTILTSTYGGPTREGFLGQDVIRDLQLLIGSDIYAAFDGTADQRLALNRANNETVIRVLAETRPDVVFVWNLFFFDGSLLDTVRQHGPRTVLMLTDNWLLVMQNPNFVADFFRNVVHGDMPFTVPELPPQPLPRPSQANVLPGLVRRVLAAFRKADHHLGREMPKSEAIFGSEFVRDFYAAGGMRFERQQVIHNGVRQVPPADGFPDRTLLVQPGTLHLLFAGRLVDLKGAHTAVAAMRLLDAAKMGLDRIELTIVGDAQDAEYMPVLQAAVHESGCADRIVLRPTVPKETLQELFAEHDIYIFPSLYEPFSLTLIHAMALGIPTVASAIGGNLEIVTEGESGLLFPKGDPQALAECILRLIADPGLRARIASGGRQSASRFTFQRMVREMSTFLKSGSQTEI